MPTYTYTNKVPRNGFAYIKVLPGIPNSAWYEGKWTISPVADDVTPSGWSVEYLGDFTEGTTRFLGLKVSAPASATLTTREVRYGHALSSSYPKFYWAATFEVVCMTEQVTVGTPTWNSGTNEWDYPVTITVQGGTSPYSPSRPASTTFGLAPGHSGTFTSSTTDSGGCSASSSTTIGPAPPAPSLTSSASSESSSSESSSDSSGETSGSDTPGEPSGSDEPGGPSGSDNTGGPSGSDDPNGSDSGTPSGSDDPNGSDSGLPSSSDDPNDSDSGLPSGSDDPNGSDSGLPSSSDNPNGSDSGLPSGSDDPNGSDSGLPSGSDDPDGSDSGNPSGSDEPDGSDSGNPSDGSHGPCWTPTVPEVDSESISREGFTVTAPDNVPGGVTLQLQIKIDGESGWSDYGSPVGANGVVFVEDLEPCSGYWVRWLPSN